MVRFHFRLIHCIYCYQEIPMRFNAPRISHSLQVMSAAAVTALTLGLGTASTVFAAPTASLQAGFTAVKLDVGFTAALSSLQVDLGTLPRSGVYQGQAYFPIVGGAIDFSNAKGEIPHAGGLTLTAGTTRVELSDFVIDTFDTKPVLTGLVVVNDSIVDRIPLFDLELPAGFTLPLQPTNRRFITLADVGVKLNAAAAGALNSVFKVTAFAGGFTIGVAKVQAVTVREH
jgi:hypothetical protein